MTCTQTLQHADPGILYYVDGGLMRLNALVEISGCSFIPSRYVRVLLRSKVLCFHDR